MIRLTRFISTLCPLRDIIIINRHHHHRSKGRGCYTQKVRLAIHTRLLPRAWLDITSTVQPSSLLDVSLQMLAQPHLPVLVNLAIASISGTEVERRKTVKLL